MDINSFKRYVLSQRQIMRWEIKDAVHNIENIIVKYREREKERERGGEGEGERERERERGRERVRMAFG